MKGYDHTLSFIVAQDPLEHTVNEFWWMIAEHAVTTMVMLAELGDGQNKCHQYWPASVDTTFDCDFVKVKLIEEEMFQYYVKRVFHVTKKKVCIFFFHSLYNLSVLQYKNNIELRRSHQ